MKSVPNEFDRYNRVVALMAAAFVVIGGYPLLMMSGPLITWLPRGIFGIFFVMGLIILIGQLQLWKRLNRT
jgi:hypothetical protein